MVNIVITGSTKGIGKGLADEFIAQGHQVVISGRNQQEIDRLIEQSGSANLYGLACNTQDKDAVVALWQFAVDKLGGVDIWVNNAGLARTVWPILETPDEEIYTMVKTNVLGTINGCKVAAAAMKEQGSGKIFNMLGGGSDGEYFPGMGIYGTTKRGLDYFTNALAKELKDDGVLVGKIRPGMIITEGVIRESNADKKNFERRRKMANALCDTVETVAPFLVREMLAFNQTGKKIRWLTPMKMTARMLKAMVITPEDKFKQFDL
ncbi:SDR family oxidoreductase [Thalassotalea mangrovi]|uniref:SDR family oxidoreductase n=1 Tax=Thalassotalea mangrovi TaxID=2572245 RepID=A0A4U1B699_9GAMM|nr:SDR family oxidoreductase [Thalassotalea mangrovi]TKB46054.1 SDR family oxidoreductase [Thalassotalea mangrovi]